MPIYEYRCEDCDRSFEALVRPQRELEDAECPNCRGGRLSRQMSVFAATRSSAGADDGAPRPAGACCGGGCGCH